jgi:hypothetical protein
MARAALSAIQGSELGYEVITAAKLA